MPLPLQAWLTAYGAAAFEWSAVLLTATSVLLAAREQVWNWPIAIAIASVAMYAVIYSRSGLYSDAALQLVFLILSFYGWYAWLYGGANRAELRVSRATARVWYRCALAGIAFWSLDATAAQHINGVAFPYLDAGTTTVSLIAQWMMTRKILENWLLWILVNAVYIPVLIVKHLYPTAILYALLLALAVKGLIEWTHSYRRHHTVAHLGHALEREGLSTH